MPKLSKLTRTDLTHWLSWLGRGWSRLSLPEPGKLGAISKSQPQPRPRRGDWIQTFTGLAVYPLDLDPAKINILDIAHALSRQCRYSGHVVGFYSVAEHSVHISRQLPVEGGLALWGLLHDASEAWLVDVAKPIKPYLPQYKKAEQRIMRLVAEKYGLCWPEPAIVKELDTRILANERVAQMTKCEREWGLQVEPIPGLVIEGWLPDQAEQMFLARFEELTGLPVVEQHRQFMEQHRQRQRQGQHSASNQPVAASDPA